MTLNQPNECYLNLQRTTIVPDGDSIAGGHYGGHFLMLNND